jgi:hypothetical protein
MKETTGRRKGGGQEYDQLTLHTGMKCNDEGLVWWLKQ